MAKELHQYRKNIRLQDYDYSSAGYYFVTIVSYKRKHIFGEVVDGEMNLSQAGKIVEQTWQDIPKHFPNTNCNVFILMPNHIHGIINIIKDEIVGARHASPLQRINGVKPQSVGTIIGSFKSSVTKKLHQTKTITQAKIWQRNYYEHIIRDEQDYQKIFEYIENNPANWLVDEENITSEFMQ